MIIIKNEEVKNVNNPNRNIYNFNAGPSALPTAVLERAQQELTNFKGTGMSVMELSHRSKTYEEVHNEAKDRLKKLLNVFQTIMKCSSYKVEQASICDDSNQLLTIWGKKLAIL